MRAAVALLVATGLAILGQRALVQSPNAPDGWLYLCGTVVLAVFAFSQHGQKPEPSASAAVGDGRRSSLGTVALLAIAVAADIYVVLQLWNEGYSPLLAWLWLGSLSVATAAAWLGSNSRLGRWKFSLPRLAQPARLAGFAGTLSSGGEIGLFLGIAALGVFLRIYRLASMPPGVFVDETNAAIDALYILEGRPDSPFGTGWFETPTMYAYYLLGLFRTIGINFTALKAASLLPSILTLLALYPLARHLFGFPAALMSTFLLAVNRWHVNMSRWGWNEVAPPLFQVGAVFFLLRGVRRRHWGDCAVGGLLLGLGMYTYLSSRLVFVALAGYVLYRLVVERGFLRRAWPGLLVFFLLWALTFAPLASTYVRNPFTFWNRTRQVSVFNDVERAGSYQPLWDNTLAHLKMFHVSGDKNPRHNLPGEPMLDPVTGVLFLVGLGYSLWRWKDHRRGLLVLWVAITLLGGILSLVDEAPQGYRTLGVVPAIAILAGDALAQATAVLSRLFRHRLAQLTPALLAMGLLGYAGWLNMDLFFNVQANDVRVWQAFSPMETALAREVAAKQHDHSLYLSHRLYYFSPLRFFTYQPLDQGGGGLDNRPYALASPSDDLPLADLSGNDALFLVDTHYEDLLELFTRYYPGTRAEMVRGPQGQALYLSVTVPGEEIVALHGLEGMYSYQDNEPALRRRDSVLSFIWPDELPSTRVPMRIEWSGSLRVPASGPYLLATEGGLALELDGRPLAAEARFLGLGLHALTITQEAPLGDGAERARLLWATPGMGQTVVPAEALFAVGPPSQGLLGRYYHGESWEGLPVFEQVSPLLLFAWPEAEPWYGAFSARWTGSIHAEAASSYFFQIHADDGVALWLDGQLIGESLQADRANMVEGSTYLEEGWHPIRVEYFQRGGGKALELWWTRPGRGLQVVPPAALRPE
jgi:hypothetical protein